jgi:hypothetical protein
MFATGQADIGDRVSELGSVIEAFRSESLAELPDAQLEEGFTELQRGVQALELERLRRLAEIDRRGSFAREGYLSAVAWLGDTHRLTWGAAKDAVMTARALEQMPRVAEALGAGEVSLPVARMLVQAREADPEAFAAAEELLVEAARRHGAQDLHRVLAHWRAAVQAGPGRDEKLRARRRLHASATLDGMVRVDGDLDPENGQLLLTALGAVLDADARSGGDSEDGRAPCQRRADALGEVCRQWLDRPDRGAVAGQRPHVSVVVGIEDLQADAEARKAQAPGDLLRGTAGTTGSWEQAGPLGPATAKRLTCDAAITRVVMAGRSEPLDVGRRTAVVPPAIRRAVAIRDGGCRFPECGRPQSWCDAHHAVHWADGGPTSVANLVLLCRRHHRMVHEGGGFSLEMTGAGPVFRRPDGSVLEERGPP